VLKMFECGRKSLEGLRFCARRYVGACVLIDEDGVKLQRRN